MLYVQATYSGSLRLYTFQTTIEDIIPGTKGLVKDVKGFSMVTLHNYVSKPSFLCRNVLLNEAMLEELDSEVSATGILAPEEEID